MGTAARTKSRRSPQPPLASDRAAGLARDEELLQAAFDIFTERGFEGATMLEIASRARASKSTLYARYATKEALFEALMEWSTRQGTEALDAVTSDTTLAPLTALHRFASILLGLMLQPAKLALFRIAVAEGARLSAVGKTFAAFTREHGRQRLSGIVTRLLRDGVVEIDDRDEFGHSFMGLLQGELYMRALLGIIATPSHDEIAAHARRAMERLVRAYAPAGPPFRRTQKRP
jgi:AcrR family transcriptional regulator